MTVTPCPGPGSGSWESTRYTASLQDTPAFVYGFTKTAIMETTAWPASSSVEVSWLQFTANEFAEVSISRIAGDITSFVVYPDEDAKPGSVPGLVAGIQGGDLVLTVPTNTRLRVEINGDRRHVMHVFSAPLVTTPVGGTVDTYVAQTEAASDRTLYFAAGVHTIGQLFPVEDDATVFLEAGAVVIGSWDLRGTDGALIHGRGVNAGTFATPESIASEPFATKLTYAMFLGYDGAKWYFDNQVDGITIVATPYYITFEGVWSWRNCHFLSCWHWEQNGPSMSSRSEEDNRSECVDCFAYAADDCGSFGEDYFSDIEVSGCFFVTNANSCIFLGYFTEQNFGTSTTIEDCHALHLGIEDTGTPLTYPVKGGNAILKLWTDGYAGDMSQGRFDVTVSNLRVWGPHASRLFGIGNQMYPYGAPVAFADRDQHGRASGIIFEDLWMQYGPGQLSYLVGLDALNAPTGLVLKRVTIGGVRLSVRNASAFVEWDDTLSNIRIDGASLVA